jgi:CRISPR-associated endonuclease/helicase Cas3
MNTTFSQDFTVLSGNSPFPWQTALFAEFTKGPLTRRTCDLPTGLGKTSIIALWLLALAHRVQNGAHAGFPRRLIYVVNRRTVVDQATREAEKLREALDRPELVEVRSALASLCGPIALEIEKQKDPLPLAISTLRGEFADNAEWSADPSRAAIIVGTVDMLGSRLLFSGYGLGKARRPLHAGFLGHDSLLVHDEAHLEPAFQRLLDAIVREQQSGPEKGRFHVMQLTATRREDANGSTSLLTDADRNNSIVAARLNAQKLMRFHEVDGADPNAVSAKVVERALAHKDSGQAILIYLRELKDVSAVAKELEKKCKVQLLTGTMRGLERDALATRDSVFACFVPERKVNPESGAVYLVCTSAGEVGIDMSADHLVCDLTPFDSMAQRFGRVNRFGLGNAQIDIVYAKTNSAKAKKSPLPEAYETARQRTLDLLQNLDGHNASPAALSALDPGHRAAAFTPSPTILPATDILFDAWSLTTVRDLPGAPPVDDWLHGVADWDPPETHVAWREEVSIITEDLAEEYPPDELLEDYPLKPHELLRDSSRRVFDELKAIAKREPELSVWIVGMRRNSSKRRPVTITKLSALIDRDDDAIAWQTVILPPAAGGLRFADSQSTGFLDGKSEYVSDAAAQYDVADQWLDSNDKPRRTRRWNDPNPPDGMREVLKIDTTPPDADADADQDEGDPNTESRRGIWYWYVQPRSADDEGSRIAHHQQDLRPHLRCAAHFAANIVEKLALPEPEATAVRLAARFHDLGKHRVLWQRAIDNRRYSPARIETAWAKSDGKKMRSRSLNKYRHEFGSLIDVLDESDFKALDRDTQELLLHLIAAHHGRARPHFPADEAFDPDHPYEQVLETARAVPQRFARLQRKYGRWGLAYLESLVRAADIMASQAKLAADDAQTTESAGAPR